jgi:hypothetical protein
LKCEMVGACCRNASLIGSTEEEGGRIRGGLRECRSSMQLRQDNEIKYNRVLMKTPLWCRRRKKQGRDKKRTGDSRMIIYLSTVSPELLDLWFCLHLRSTENPRSYRRRRAGHV